ncbi:hypothetical protein [Bradyrhizobium sp. WSM4349]|uniref:hypothetical protein n=1 Tax=Bradyrhizobium sp. WSM4349 TaxID=1040988 RepID=UPI000368F964|nr:hypothetical protein [Bradyrhizobium sp. WSM4349]
MKVIMTSYHTLADGTELKPGDPHEHDDAEARRLVGVGGARLPTKEDEVRLEAHARERAKADLRMQLEASTNDELKAGAEQRGIDLNGATKKAEIIAAIVAWMDERETAEREASAAAGSAK